jgi:HlyD family secretion protein
MNPQAKPEGSRISWQRQFRRRFCAGLPMASTVAAVLFACTLGSVAAYSAAPDGSSGLAVSAARSKNACFSDMLVAVGTVVPRGEILVRPDREGLQIREILVEAGETVFRSQVLARLAAPNDQPASAIAIPAPAGGLVLAAPTVVGETVSPRGEPLFRIVADGDLDLSAEFPAKEATRLAAGQTAKVKVAGINDTAGRVRVVSTTVDPSTQLSQVRISLEHNPLLRVGTFARATIDLGESCGGVAVPLSALLFGPEGPVVQVIRDNRIETRRVVVGLFAESKVQIREGLAEGDIVVVRAGAFLREADRVRPVVSGQ